MAEKIGKPFFSFEFEVFGDLDSKFYLPLFPFEIKIRCKFQCTDTCWSWKIKFPKQILNVLSNKFNIFRDLFGWIKKTPEGNAIGHVVFYFSV